MKLKIYTESRWNGEEIEHNHLDCPFCKSEYEDSEQYGNISEDQPYEIECSNCHTIFTTEDYPYWSDAEWEIEKHGAI